MSLLSLESSWSEGMERGENEDQDGKGSGINNIHMNDNEEIQINKYLLSAFSPTLRLLHKSFISSPTLLPSPPMDLQSRKE